MTVSMTVAESIRRLDSEGVPGRDVARQTPRFLARSEFVLRPLRVGVGTAARVSDI